MTALSGTETVEQAYGARASCCAQGLGAHAAVLPEEVPDALDALPRAALVDPRRRRRRRARRRAGRRARADRRPLDQGRAPRNGARVLDRAARARQVAAAPSASITDLIGRATPRLRSRATLDAQLGAALLPARARRTAAASPTPGAPPPTASRPTREPIGLLIVSGDEAAADPAVRALAEQAERVIGIAMFEDSLARLLPTSSCRARATSSATGRTSTSRAACSACAAP